MRIRHPLARFTLARLLQSVIVLIGALIVCFVLSAASGDPADVLSTGNIGATTPEQVQALREQLGYGDPFLERFANFLSNAWHGDFGVSYRSDESATATVLNALPNTLVLVACALALALLLALALSVASVLTRDRRTDRVIRRVLAVVQGLPDFWLAITLVLIFAVTLQWLPSIGFDSPSALILPTIAIAIPLLPTFVRLTRANLLDVMQLDFITSLRAKGLSERQVVMHHALRNALPPLVTFTALQLGWLIGGTIIVETIFAWPGIGNLAVDAVRNRDTAVVQAVVAVVALSYVLLNLAADLLVAVLDPRIRVARA